MTHPNESTNEGAAVSNGEITVCEDPGAFYDRISSLHAIAAAVTGYPSCLRNYFRTHPPPSVPGGARVLDAGSGTGLLTVALLEASPEPLTITAVDLSERSLQTAARAVHRVAPERAGRVRYVCDDILNLPFAAESFDLIVTCGAFEYVPLDEAFEEFSRVLAPGGQLVYFPIRPNSFAVLLEAVFQFRTRTPAQYVAAQSHRFEVVAEQRFPFWRPFGWTKTAVVLRRR